MTVTAAVTDMVTGIAGIETAIVTDMVNVTVIAIGGTTRTEKRRTVGKAMGLPATEVLGDQITEMEMTQVPLNGDAGMRM